MTIEEYLIAYLKSKLTPNVSGSVPHPMPAQFITVEKTGERVASRIPTAQIHVKSWSTSRDAADQLNELVKTAMLGAVENAEISHVDLDASYNNPDQSAGKPRYSAAFSVTYLF